MKLNRLCSLVLAFALLFVAFAFASPPNAAANTAVKAEKTAKTGFTVAGAIADTVNAVAPIAPTNYVNLTPVPPVTLPDKPEQTVVRRFYGYVTSRSIGKIPIKPLNINAVGRFEPDFVPLN